MNIPEYSDYDYIPIFWLVYEDRKVIISQVTLKEEHIKTCSLSSARVSSENYAK